ncbi:hypothetical protein ACVQ11_005863, partial [Escherichia coli]
ESILNQYGEKAFLIMLYINMHRTGFNKAYISLANCIEESGYKLNDTKGKTNDQFKDVLKILIKDKKITTNTNRFKLNDLIVCELEEINKDMEQIMEGALDIILEKDITIKEKFEEQNQLILELRELKN